MSSALGNTAALILCSLLASAPALWAEGMELRKVLIGATLKAIDLEIESYTSRLKTAEAGTGPRENVERFKRRLQDLAAERAAFGSTKPEDFPDPAQPDGDPAGVLEQAREFGPVRPPAVRRVAALVDDLYADGSLLTVEGAGRSGPFYHLAGIAGGDYRILEEGKRYRLTLCLVYRREYFGLIGDYYVYIADVR